MSPFMSSQNDPTLHALVRESGPQLLSFFFPQFSSTVTMVGFVVSQGFWVLPRWNSAGLFSWAGSADHWLTFRGLPAEGLRDYSREAASLPTTHAGIRGVP